MVPDNSLEIIVAKDRPVVVKCRLGSHLGYVMTRRRLLKRHFLRVIPTKRHVLTYFQTFYPAFTFLSHTFCDSLSYLAFYLVYYIF